jgi:hypothetical protein
LIAALRVTGTDSQTAARREQAAFAAAYLALKNAAVSRVSSEAVRGFSWFRRALAALQNIYDQDKTLFQSDSGFLETLRKNVVHSRSFASDVRFAVRPDKLRLDTPSRSIGGQWRAAAKAGENDSVGIVLAFHRSDMEKWENRSGPKVSVIIDLIAFIARFLVCTGGLYSRSSNSTVCQTQP